jgi:ectoine hydroxylase-related dioxygenase (phytanoyl-CoA dioxygenase family)
MTISLSNAARLRGPLSAQQLDTFDQTGWTVAEGLFSPEEVQAISDWSDELQAREEVVGGHWIYRQANLLDPSKKVIQRIENFVPSHAGFAELANASRLSDAMTQLFGEPSRLFKEKINFKEPGGEGFKLHQDQQAGWGRYAPFFITAMVCIDPSTLENGCLELSADLPRATALIGEEWRPLDEQETGLTMLKLPMKPGDAIFFDSFAPHSSQDNLSSSRRRALFFTYNGASHGDVRQRYHDDKRAACPPDIERAPGAEYKFRV